MDNQFSNEPMLEMYIFETSRSIEQIEALILECEKTSSYSQAAINEIFRLMHTIKGSSAMMLYNGIAELAHSVEDLFFFIREQKPVNIDYSSLSDIVFEGIDFMKVELERIKIGEKADGDSEDIVKKIKKALAKLERHNPGAGAREKPAESKTQQYYIPHVKTDPVPDANMYKATIFFEDGCEMENVRAYTVIHNLKELTEEYYHLPDNILDNDDSVDIIREHGFAIYVRTDKSYKEMHEFFMQTIFLRELELIQIDDEETFAKNSGIGTDKEESESRKPEIKPGGEKEQAIREQAEGQTHGQNLISVNVSKLDRLMDMVGEMVISEAMVVQNPDLRGLKLNNFMKAARQLQKITGEIQDMVMSIRMVPLSATFHKMHRIARDMGKKLDKEVRLVLAGEETEVDKNIIEHISDPLMHLVRNSLDHGIETAEERLGKGKPRTGTITLEARNAGSDVLIIVRDDGKGLDKAKILARAAENGLLHKPENEMTDKEIFNLVFQPGFSTKESVTEFSGRGVGMDVVVKNIETVGGSVSMESVQDAGSTVIMKIPLTLSIIDGMNLKVGNSKYTIPTTSIRESFRPKPNQIITDPDGNEMIMVRGSCYPILRLHRRYSVDTQVTGFTDGILIMIEQDERAMCLFADELLGQQQVVVKTLPKYVRNVRKRSGLAGCTLLGDGSISLILDVGSFIRGGNN